MAALPQHARWGCFSFHDIEITPSPIPRRRGFCSRPRPSSAAGPLLEAGSSRSFLVTRPSPHRRSPSDRRRLGCSWQPSIGAIRSTARAIARRGPIDCGCWWTLTAGRSPGLHWWSSLFAALLRLDAITARYGTVHVTRVAGGCPTRSVAPPTLRPGRFTWQPAPLFRTPTALPLIT